MPQFRTSQEAATWLKTQGLADFVAVEGYDVRLVNQAAQALNDARRRNPGFTLDWFGDEKKVGELLAERLRPIIEQDVRRLMPREIFSEAEIRGTIEQRLDIWRSQSLGNAMAAYQRVATTTGTQAELVGRGIQLNSRWFQDYDTYMRELQRGRDAGWMGPGSVNPRYILDHEIGHHYEVWNDEPMKQLWTEAQSSGNFVSSYAATDIKEFVAEGWADFLNNPTPTAQGQAIGEYIETWLKRRKM